MGRQSNCVVFSAVETILEMHNSPAHEVVCPILSLSSNDFVNDSQASRRLRLQRVPV